MKLSVLSVLAFSMAVVSAKLAAPEDRQLRMMKKKKSNGGNGGKSGKGKGKSVDLGAGNFAEIATLLQTSCMAQGASSYAGREFCEQTIGGSVVVMYDGPLGLYLNYCCDPEYLDIAAIFATCPLEMDDGGNTYDVDCFEESSILRGAAVRYLGNYHCCSA